jgi:type II secretory pathway pseudopilin PulG
MKRTLRNQRGLSLTEVTIMLSVLSVLTAVLTPTIGDYVNDARQIKASDDVKVLASTFSRFAFDVPQNRNLARSWATAQLLVGPGDAPDTAEGSDAAWAAPVDGEQVGELEDHLMVNTPGYPTRQAGPRYVAGGWRGAYLSELTPDPWGHRYAINVQSFSSGTADVIVLSPGPNGVVETAFAADGVAPGGDDIVAVISGGR